MSYILDALKRAESERSRGAVPNIHAQPDAVGDSEPQGGRAGWVPAVLVGLPILALAAGGWWWFSRSESAPSNPADAVGEESVPALATPPIASTMPPAAFPPPVAPAAPAPPNPPATVAVVQALPAPTRPPAASGTVPTFRLPTLAPTGNPSAGSAPPAATPPRSQFSLPMARVPKPDKALATVGASAPVGAQSEERIYAIKELPDNIRNSLPALKVSGATYSESPANRMLIVNGNIFHEGDKLTPEVSLQQIKLRAAVLSFRGYRYSISY